MQHHRSFQFRDATITSVAEDPEDPHSGASSRSKQAAASRAHTVFGSLGASLWKQRPESTGANVSVVLAIFSSQSKGKRSRSNRSAFVERENIQKILVRKVDSAVRGERMAQQTV